MSKSKKIILGLLLFLVAAMGVLFSYVASKISPEEIRKLTITTIEQNLPQTKVELGKIDYSLGTSIKIYLDQFQLKLPEASYSKNYPNKDLFKVERLEVHVPLWTMITASGRITLIIDKPSLNYIESADNLSNNWAVALDNRPEGKEDEAAKKKQENGGASATSNPKVVEFFSRNKMDVKISAMGIHYELGKKGSGDLQLGRLLLNNIGLDAPTAFEIASHISSLNEKNEKTSLDLVAVGSLNLHEIVQGKNLSSNTILTLENLSTPALKGNFPVMKSEISLLVEEVAGLGVDGKPLRKINLGINSNISQIGSVGATITVLDQVLDVKNLKMNLALKELFSYLQNAPATVNWGESKFELSGDLKKVGDQVAPSIRFAIAPKFMVTIPNSPEIMVGMAGAYLQDDFNLKIDGVSKSGLAKVDMDTRYAIDLKNISPENIPPIKMDILVSKIKIPGEFIQKTLYAPAPVSSNNNASTGSRSSESGGSGTEAAAPSVSKADINAKAPKFPAVSLKIKWDQVMIDRELFSGNGQMQIQGNKIVSDGINFGFSQGKGLIRFTSLFKAAKVIETDFIFKLNKLNLDSLMPFLPKNIDKISGTFDGDTSGQVTTSLAPPKFAIKTNLEAIKGEVKFIDLNKTIGQVFTKIPIIKDKIAEKDINIPNNFEKMKFAGNFTPKEYNLQNIYFLGVNRMAEISGKGTIHPLGQSEMFLDFKDNTGQIGQLLKKNVGVETLMLRLVGTGFDLAPDYKYTVELMAKAAFEKNKEKLKEKVVEKIKDKIAPKIDQELDKLKDKVFQGDEGKTEKVKKLFKGLFN